MLVAQGPDLVSDRSEKQYRVTIFSREGRMGVYVDEVLEVEWTDDGTYGPAFGEGGCVGLRTMDYTIQAIYQVLHIHKITDYKSDFTDVVKAFFLSHNKL